MALTTSIAASPIRRGLQRQIAERAGVSVSTVSRVLNNVAGISDDLRERVRTSAIELGYLPQDSKPQAQLRHVTLVSSIGIFPPNAEAFYLGIVAGIEAECRRNKLDLNYVAFEPGLSSTAFMLDKIKQHGGDGLLLLAIDERSLIEQMLATGAPMVLVNADHPDLSLDTFLPDNWFASYRAVRYLIDQGHRRILHLSFSNRPTIQRRHQAYRAALEAAGIAYDPALVLDNAHMESASAHEAMRAFLSSPHRDFTAVFCANDTWAIGIVHALQEAGLQVPEDVSVIGYDDIPLAALITPPLTTVRVEREELGAIAVRRLVERVASPQLTPIRVELACRLIERQSVARVKSSR